MTRKRKIVVALVAVVGLAVASIGVKESQTGGCSGCQKATQEQRLDGGGDHHFPNQSEEIHD